jgi:hypothetical protein
LFSGLCILNIVGACANADSAAVKAAPRISDTSFQASARQVCTQTVHTFDVATTLPKQPSADQSADVLLMIDRTFADLVSQLRQIPVVPADQPAVSGWLADWDSYVAFGQTYAAAVRGGKERELVQNNSASQGALRRRLQAFAVANHMASCKFQ